MSTISGRRVASVAVVLGLAITGCSSSSNALDETSSCRDFLQADPAEQDQAVARVAEKLGVKGVQSPLARPNINYICGNDPGSTLGSAVQGSGTP